MSYSPIYHNYNKHLEGAYQASKAVDDFDLHSKRPISVEKFKQLLKEQQDTSIKLVEFITANSKKLLKFFQLGSHREKAQIEKPIPRQSV